MREYEPSLSPYWREYLRRFDRALRERTPGAWAACHEMAPQGERRQIPPDPAFARLLRSLEA